MLNNFLETLGFTKIQNNYISNTKYPIKVTYNIENPQKSIIDYGSEIVVHHRSTSNFDKPENYVVLECVIRLLKKGYPANKIELEKEWKLGHKNKGRLDILVKDTKNIPFAMIECKQWGEEYLKERNNILEDGGQLLSYYIQERKTKFLILYASKMDVQNVDIQAEAIDVERLSGFNLDGIFNSWDKSFIPNGIFDTSTLPYFSKKTNIKKSALKELDKTTGQGLFNSFAEILRRNVISDKSNAFNKIFNLFVCKILDEDTKTGDQELDFQWKTDDTPESLLSRLSDLFQRGLSNYLRIETNSKYLSFINEFSFIDVLNEETFAQNLSTVREVVELLQPYQIKYSSKHQFLGDFFEKLLNTSIKQEAGQFFTPTPLARFFLKSIPIKNIINKKIENGEANVLPYILDYACGAGHFLTEAMDEVEENLQHISLEKISGRARSQYEATKHDYVWAKEYIYGIEKDYRLAKTSKIAMFLNGDGEATILHADGLDDFFASKQYTGLLKTNTPTKELSKFDILVTNPPFSISGFRRYIKNGSDNFNLYKYLSSKSSEIECLFIERMKDVLSAGASAGIILPLSILNNKNRIYVEARKIILINFEVIGLVELREKTFIATPTTTISFFLKKRSQDTITEALQTIYGHFFEKESDLINLIIKSNPVLSEKEDIKSEFTRLKITSQTIIQNKYDISQFGNKLALLLSLLLSFEKSVVIAYSGDKKEQERFLGYRFSSSRGKEGISFFTKNGRYHSSLYDIDDINNPEKVNAHIRARYLDKQIEVPDSLQNNLAYTTLNNLITRDDLVISNPSSYFENDNYIISSNSPFGDFIDTFEQTKYSFKKLVSNEKVKYISGLIYKKELDVPRKTNNKVLTASNIDLQLGKLIFDKIIYLDESVGLPNELKPRKGDIVISNASGSLKHLGKCAYINEDVDAVIGGFLAIIRPNNEKLGKAIFYRLISISFRKFISSLKDQNINNLGASEIDRFNLLLPSNLDEFYKQAIEKEKMLENIELQKTQLIG